MCTVTFIPTNGGFYFTSSRDEQYSRATLPPQKYHRNHQELFYPKDVSAGGTWIAASTSGKTACLLNGAFTAHTHTGGYNRSRGLVLLERFDFDSAISFANAANLNNVEPFTLLTLDHPNGQLTDFYELRWDGKHKHLSKVAHTDCQIWSSATLYNPSAQAKRKELFEHWIKANSAYPDCNILNFHNRKHGLHTNEDIIMKGTGDLMTLSITQVVVANDKLNFNYYDVVDNKEYKTEI